MKLLIVVNDISTGSLLLRMLEPYFRHIDMTHDGENGLRLFFDKSPDVVLSETSLPGMKAEEMIRRIREADSSVKVAALANLDNKQQLHRVMQLGVDQFFCKPFEKEFFVTTMRQLATELREKRAVNMTLRRQKKILQVINDMAEHFLQHTDWEEMLKRQMLALMSAAEASALFIFENEASVAPQVAREYLAINDDPTSRSPQIVSYRSLDIMQWKHDLSKGRTVHGLIEDFSSAEQHLLYDYRINSLLLIPIFAEERWWGFMGIGNNEQRPFDGIDRRSLNTAARIIGSAINNKHNVRSLEMTSAIFKHTVDGVVITDAENKIVHTNDAFTNITGFSPEEVIGKNPKILRSATHDKKFYSDMWRKINEEGYWQGEIKNRKKRGEVYLEWLSINAIKNKRGEVENYIAVFSDITSHRGNDAKYAYLATHDALTGLSNRLILNDRLEHAVTHAKRFNKMVGVLFCDLDNFKPINDTYGHHVGDAVLKACADYFKSTLRGDDTICRYGGDEFVIILEDLDEVWHLGALVEKIMGITTRTMKVEGHPIRIQMSVGISLYPLDGDASTLVSRADEAMYRAKKSGKNRFALYNDTLLPSAELDLSERHFDFSI